MATNEAERVQQLQRTLYRTAKQSKAVKFYSLYDKVWRNDVLWEAWKQVKANRGAPGVDSETIEGIVSRGEEEQMLSQLQEQLRGKNYRFDPVRRVDIPKPKGGTRPLGIATVRDRVVQTAMKLVLEPIFEADFHPCSYGYRPQRNAKMASTAIRTDLYARAWGVVEIDFRSYFTTIPHDKLMILIKQRVVDGSMLRLIKQSLTVEVAYQGKMEPTAVGVPQGSPISPLYSNIYLNLLDCNIYVRSERAGQRVMMSITRFITQRLKLKVNEAKSAVARPQERKFLGFSFTDGPEIRRAIAPKALMRFKDKIREITRQAKGISIETTVKRLATYMVGWRGYFGFCETPEVLIGLVRWVRLRLRCALWRQWKTPRRRRAALLQLGVRPRLAANTAGSGRGPWYLARSKALSVGASNAYFRSLGLPSLFGNY
jgi:RNA-directed DNA polymerase